MINETIITPEIISNLDKYQQEIEHLINTQCPIDQIGARIMRIYTHYFSDLSAEQYAKALADLDSAMYQVMRQHPELFPTEKDADKYAIGAHTELSAILIFRKLGFDITLPSDAQDRLEKTDLIISLGNERYCVQTKNLALKVNRRDAQSEYPPFPAISRVESFDDLISVLSQMGESFGASHTKNDITISWYDTSRHENGTFDMATLNKSALEALILSPNTKYSVNCAFDSTYLYQPGQVENLATSAIRLYGSRLRTTTTNKQPTRLLCVVNGNKHMPSASDYDFDTCIPTGTFGRVVRNDFVALRGGE